MATTEGQANNFDEPSVQKHFMSYIICVENQKQSKSLSLFRIWIGRKHIWQKNIFGPKLCGLGQYGFS